MLSISIREIQIETTVRCHLKPARVAIAKKTTKTFWRGCREKGTLCTAGRSVTSTETMESNISIPQKIKHRTIM